MGAVMRSLSNLNISELEDEASRVAKDVASIELQLGHLKANLNEITTELAKRRRPAPEPRLSDHALLRYLERIKGVDVEGARREIMTPSVIEAIKAMATSVIVNGAKFLVRDGCVVTIMEAEKKGRIRTHARELDEDEKSAWRTA